MLETVQTQRGLREISRFFLLPGFALGLVALSPVPALVPFPWPWLSIALCFVPDSESDASVLWQSLWPQPSG